MSRQASWPRAFFNGLHFVATALGRGGESLAGAGHDGAARTRAGFGRMPGGGLVSPQTLAAEQVRRRTLDHNAATVRLAGRQEASGAGATRRADASRVESEPPAGRAAGRSAGGCA